MEFLAKDKLARQLAIKLAALPVPDCYWIAYSGGLDSSVLLHLLVSIKDELRSPLRAVHVNHGLQLSAETWADHCQEVCHDAEIPLTSLSLALSPEQGNSLEAFAREQRYSALASLLEKKDMLLTAHHGDDQLETLLLQMFRGGRCQGFGCDAGEPQVKDAAAGQAITGCVPR